MSDDIKQLRETRARRELEDKEYSEDDDFWWVKITDYQDEDGRYRAMKQGTSRSRYWMDGWIGDMGCYSDIKAIERAFDIVQLHNTDLIRRVHRDGLTVQEYHLMLRKKRGDHGL